MEIELSIIRCVSIFSLYFSYFLIFFLKMLDRTFIINQEFEAFKVRNDIIKLGQLQEHTLRRINLIKSYIYFSDILYK